jgi:glycolate oxidase iron-sulfur subunit
VNACPTYAITGLEAESPRGRIYLARAVAEEVIPVTTAVQGHWDLCLQCRACEAVCPSGVPYGRIMERTRAQVAARPASGKWSRRIRRQVLRNVVARPRMLRLAMAPARLAGRRPVRWMLRRSGAMRLMPGIARRGLEQLPSRMERPFRAGEPLGGADPRTDGAALLFVGCVMGEIFGGVHRATGRVLAAWGIGVVAPEGQGCCGALHAHDGDLAFARKLARENIEVFERAGDGTIVVNSAGCGAAMKEYGDLLRDDATFAQRAEAFAGRVKDLTEVLTEGEALPEAQLRFAGRVTYQDPCHLAHAQGIRNEPRALLAGVTGCELVETKGADMCCGAAGLYSMVQPEMSAQLRGRKAAAFAEVAPDVIVTANPGCQLQYEGAVREARLQARVMHLAEFLDEALMEGSREQGAGSRRG